MNALQQFPTSINAFIAWCTDQGAKKAGLPVAEFERLHAESDAVLQQLAVTRKALDSLHDMWNRTVDEAASSPPATELLAAMNDASTKTEVLQGQTGSMQAALQPLLPIVASRKTGIAADLTDIRARLTQAHAEKQRLDARIAETKRKLAAGEGNTKKLRQKLAQDSFSTITNDVLNLENNFATQELLHRQLSVCDDLSSALTPLRSALTACRNLMAAAGEPLSSAIRAEGKVLGTSRNGVAAYYKREVGQEMAELMAVFA